MTRKVVEKQGMKSGKSRADATSWARSISCIARCSSGAGKWAEKGTRNAAAKRART